MNSTFAANFLRQFCVKEPKKRAFSCVLLRANAEYNLDFLEFSIVTAQAQSLICVRDAGAGGSNPLTLISTWKKLLMIQELFLSHFAAHHLRGNSPHTLLLKAFTCLAA